MAAKHPKSTVTSWAAAKGMPPFPNLWDQDTLLALALFACVSFGLVAYVLLVVADKKKDGNKETAKDKSE
jgi:hypothetical protein